MFYNRLKRKVLSKDYTADVKSFWPANKDTKKQE